jgi:hypothetical protein
VVGAEPYKTVAKGCIAFFVVLWVLLLLLGMIDGGHGVAPLHLP